MIDRNEAVQAFKEKFRTMSQTEREEYLRKMGFSFEEETVKIVPAARNGKCYPALKVASSKRNLQATKKRTSRRPLGPIVAMKVND